MDLHSLFDHSEYLAWAKTFRADLDSAIVALRKRVSDNQKAGIVILSDLCELEHKLGQRFQLLEMTEDALERVALCRTALTSATDKNDADTISIMIRLAEALIDCFSESENVEVEVVAWLDEAVELGRKVVSLLEDCDPNVPVAICAIGSALRLRYNRLHDLKDLEEAIALHTSVTDDRYASHPQFYWFTAQLGSLYYKDHSKRLELDTIKCSKRLYLQAVELCSNEDSRRHSICRGYVCCLKRLVHNTRNAPLAHEVLHAFQELAQLYREIGHPLTDILLHIQVVYTLLGDLEDDPRFWLMAIECAQEIQAHTMGDDRIRSHCLNASIAISLLRRQGDPTHIAAAIEALEECLKLKNVYSLSRTMAMVNLGALYGTRYEALGHRTDLDGSIKHYRNVFAFSEVHPEVVSVGSSNLSLSLVCRFDVEGNPNDLDEALDLSEKALRSVSIAREHRAHTLSHIADILLRRYQLAQERSDLNRAIDTLEESVQAPNAPIAYQSDHLLSLSRALLLRWKDFKIDESQINTALQLVERALQLRQSGHPRRHEVLNVLSEALCIRFIQLHSHEDYNTAVQYQKEAIDILPRESAFRPQALFGLARLFLLLDAPCFNPTSAMELCTEALECNISTAYLCLQDIINIQPALESVARLPSFSPDQRRQLLNIYRITFNLLPQVAYFGLDAPTRLRVLKGAESFATTAAAHAILLDQPKTAVEILEQGRGFFWSQGLKLRSQFDELPTDLREKLSNTAHQLEAAMCRTQDSSPKEKAEIEEMDRKIRRLSDGFQVLIKQIRNIPGHERFLLPLDFTTLSTAARRGPIVVFLASEIINCALIVRYSSTVQIVALAGISSELYDAMDASIQNVSLITHRQTGHHLDALDPECLFVQNPEYFRLGLAKPHRLSTNSLLERLLEQIWNVIMQPVVDALNIEPSHGRGRPRVWLCPSGKLTFLPLHAAGAYSKGERGCLDYFVPSYTPTIDNLLWARSRKGLPTSLNETKILLAAVPVPFQGYKLPETVREMVVVRDIVPKNCLLDMESEENSENVYTGGTKVDTVLDAIPNASVLHIASHGIQDRTNALNSGFAMQDGMLTLAKLMSLNLSKASLAILSACDTAKGDSSHPDQALHLAAAMLFVGFRSVIGTMWSMHDLDGPNVSKELYQQLFGAGSDSAIDPDNVAYALDAAVQVLRKSGAPAIRWAPYVHMGL